MRYDEELGQAQLLAKQFKEIDTSKMTEWTIAMIIMGWLSSSNLTVNYKLGNGGRPTS